MSYIRPPDLSGTIEQCEKELDRYFVDVDCVTEHIENTYIDACNKLFCRSVPNPVNENISTNPVINDVTNAHLHRQNEGSEQN